MRNFLTEFFTFSKRELRSMLIFGLVLFLTIVGRLILPLVVSREETIDPELIAESKGFVESLEKIEEKETGIKEEKKDRVAVISYDLDPFDPNIISKEELIESGLPSFLVENLLKYRKAGGKFSVPEDVLRIYGMNNEIYHEIKDRIRIKEVKKDSIQSELTIHSSISDSVEINSCNYYLLSRLLNGNNSLASRILNYRNLLGGYSGTGQLKEVYGLSDSIYQAIYSRIYTDTSLLRKLSLTNSDYREFLRHPYLNKASVDLIFAYRNFSKENASIEEFIKLEILPDSLILLVLPYLQD